MQRSVLLALVSSTLLGAWSSPLCAQYRAGDDFNRANSTLMGATWREDSGDCLIENNEAKGNSRFTNGWMEFQSLYADYRRARLALDVRCNGGGGDHVALIAGLNPATWDAVYVRLQDNNGDSLFDRVLFERGITGGGWGGGTPVRYDLAVPTVSARLELDFEANGDRVVLRIHNAASGLVEQCQASGLLSMPFGVLSGTAFGIGHFGDPYFDNFLVELETLEATPSSISLATAGTQTLNLDFGPSQAGRGYVILGSISGTQPGFYLDGQLVPLSIDSYFLYTLEAVGQPPLQNSVGFLDALGRAQASFIVPPSLPTSLVGLVLHHAAIVYEPSGAAPLIRATSNAGSLELTR